MLQDRFNHLQPNFFTRPHHVYHVNIIILTRFITTFTTSIAFHSGYKGTHRHKPPPSPLSDLVDCFTACYDWYHGSDSNPELFCSHVLSNVAVAAAVESYLVLSSNRISQHKYWLVYIIYHHQTEYFRHICGGKAQVYHINERMTGSRCYQKCFSVYTKLSADNMLVEVCADATSIEFAVKNIQTKPAELMEELKTIHRYSWKVIINFHVSFTYANDYWVCVLCWNEIR